METVLLNVGDISHVKHIVKNVYTTIDRHYARRRATCRKYHNSAQCNPVISFTCVPTLPITVLLSSSPSSRLHIILLLLLLLLLAVVVLLMLNVSFTNYLHSASHVKMRHDRTTLHRSTAIPRLLLYKDTKKGQRKDWKYDKRQRKRHTGRKRRTKECEEQLRTAFSTSWCNKLFLYVIFVLRVLSLLVNSITVLLFRRFPSTTISVEPAGPSNRRTPHNARLRPLHNSLNFISYSHCGFADTRHYSVHMGIQKRLFLDIWQP
jgi:hypothetical protein